MSAFQHIGIVTKADSREAISTAHELAGWLERRGVTVALDEATARARDYPGETYHPEGKYDLVIALGGDGTLLVAARAQGGQAPILGVNLGRLGFLTELPRSELYPSLVKVLDGEFSIEERSLLDVELLRAGGGTQRYRFLNDAVIAKSALAKIIEFTLHTDGHLVAHYRADGLILSTPTGSTAYNLSANGPIVDPSLPVVVITPICPHTISLRPLVVPDGGILEVRLETHREEVYLTVDGQEGTRLGWQDTVRITRCPTRVRLVKTGKRSFYDSLRDKLRWGGLHDPSQGAP